MGMQPLPSPDLSQDHPKLSPGKGGPGTSAGFVTLRAELTFMGNWESEDFIALSVKNCGSVRGPGTVGSISRPLISQKTTKKIIIPLFLLWSYG